MLSANARAAIARAAGARGVVVALASVLALGQVAALGACTDEVEPAWMSRVDDSRSVASLVIPGTHDSGAMLEPLLGLAKTQDLTIAEQLRAGVRFLDLRARIVDDELWLYHGAIDQDQAFDDVFGEMYSFLDANPSEVILASLKEETGPANATKAFDTIFAEYVARSPEHWRLDVTLPAMGDARGQIVLVRRFSSTMAPLGIDAAPWADDATFSIANAAKLRVQDEYTVAVNDEKWTAISALLDEPRDATTLYLDYTSGYQTNDMGLSNILAVSDDINARLDARLVSGSIAPTVFVMDHVTVDRVKSVIDANE